MSSWISVRLSEGNKSLIGVCLALIFSLSLFLSLVVTFFSPSLCFVITDLFLCTHLQLCAQILPNASRGNYFVIIVIIFLCHIANLCVTSLVAMCWGRKFILLLAPSLSRGLCFNIRCCSFSAILRREPTMRFLWALDHAQLIHLNCIWPITYWPVRWRITLLFLLGVHPVL